MTISPDALYEVRVDLSLIGQTTCPACSDVIYDLPSGEVPTGARLSITEIGGRVAIGYDSDNGSHLLVHLCRLDVSQEESSLATGILVGLALLFVCYGMISMAVDVWRLIQ